MFETKKINRYNNFFAQYSQNNFLKQNTVVVFSENNLTQVKIGNLSLKKKVWAFLVSKECRSEIMVGN